MERAETTLAETEPIRLRLFDWWSRYARDLPWRFGRTTPWGVLVSEVMSQQTQMSRVVPYWTAWMKVWPDAASLAAAPKAEVITAWGRLGYPRRALRLQECARQVASQYADRLPRDYDQLVALPGIGDYTASAVMSFAYGERIAVIDTNIRRVLSRVFLGRESKGGAASREERQLAWQVLPEDEDSEVSDHHVNGDDSLGTADPQIRSAAWREPPSTRWNQAVMELGATVCVARKPVCDICPLAGHCRFLKAGLPGLGAGRTRPRQRFAGTDRQIRGSILQALRQASGAPVSRKDLKSLCDDEIRLDRCIASLDEDGLLEIGPDGLLSLPQ
ncbi:A/G-specific adenine glycosylase [Bifidobacterium sp. B4107]|uniref:A/G-specific adenine glycosylase n=1 Tax=unclassified Bifidobacterium TaxID=2608897 RepID=UPI00226BAAC9|nr:MULTISPECIES: A/G-specific adenine glycosylase [unclassified Bifidobacterium]MCX8647615.1 A/G-specific adenine glycosylase [Bifidobacterium sp. B4107]MCX8651795.1 A/G-specific adenine glycosylase [Bifidobacterium sp. B4111]MCX8658569.1 A/G-specific adenine glycosylase [Bifidobacterium sp. B4114]